MQKKIVSILLCAVMLFSICIAGMTASATHYPSPGMVSGYTMGDTLTVNGMKYECITWWTTTEPPGVSWKELGPDDTSGDKNQNTAQKSITINVLPTDDKIYMGYGTLKDVFLDPSGNKLRNYIPCDKIILKEGEPIILYMTAQIPGKWYLDIYDDCVLLELTSNGLEVTGASYDWRGITKKEINNYKLAQKFNSNNQVISAQISYQPNSVTLFDLKGDAIGYCGDYYELQSNFFYYVDYNEIEWTSSNNNIIAIASVGQKKYLQYRHPGKATLTATTQNGKTQSIDITVSVDMTLQVGTTQVHIGINSNNGYLITYPSYNSYPVQYMKNNIGTYTAIAPVRFIGESIGYTVDYIEETKDVKLTDNIDGHYICMRVGETEITSYSKQGTLIDKFHLPTSVTLINGVTFAPLRTISEYSGLHCQFFSDKYGDFIILDDYEKPLSENECAIRIGIIEFPPPCVHKDYL